MSFKKTIVFFIIFLVLAGYYLIQGDMMKQEQIKEEAAKKLFTIAESDMTKLTLTRGEEKILLEKQDGNWKMLQPVEAAADDSTVATMLSEFVKVERDSTIADDDSQDEEFGLNKPALIVAAQGKEGEEPLKLSFGKDTPVSSKSYARVGDEKPVILVANTIKTGLDKTVFDLRDKTVLDFDPPQVKKAVFTLAQAEGGETETIELEQNDSLWNMTAPNTYNVDTSKIGSILSKVKSSKVEEFVSEDAEDLSQYGLDKPVATLALTVGEDSSQKTLVLGKTDEEKKGIYAKHEGAANVFLVSSTILDEFPKSVSDLRDKTLLSFKNDEVRKLALVSPAETIMLERESGGAEGEEDTWKMTQPEQFEADDSKVRQLLSGAGLLKVEEFVTDKADDLSTYGLESPQLTVQVWTQGQDAAEELLLGNSTEEHSGIYAKLASEDAIVLVKPDALTTLHTTVFDLREKKILGIKQSDVEKLRIEYADGPTFELEKNDEEWVSKQPEEKTLIFYKVNNIVYDLENLEFTQKITEPEADSNVYGLVQPDVNVTLWEKDGKEIAFSIGKELEGQEIRYLKNPSESVLYAIDPAFLNELPKEMTDIAE